MIIKVCSCGREYAAEQWNEIPSAGIQSGMMDDVRVTCDLELRGCACGSTMALPVGKDENGKSR